MIVLDIETTGLDSLKNGIVSIGAVSFNNPNEIFYEECRIDSDDVIDEEALKINGFTKEQITDKNKQSQSELINNFYFWLGKQDNRILAGHNIGFFDLNFIKAKVIKYNIIIKSRHRSIDLCSVAQTKYFEIYKDFLIDDFKENAMNLPNILKFCGLKDNRNKHNALEDAKLAAECFSRLFNGRILFNEYEKYPVPNYLMKL